MGLVALTRVTFGAHFPIDVAVGAVLGFEFGLFAASLMANTGLLPARAPARSRLQRLLAPEEPAGRTV